MTDHSYAEHPDLVRFYTSERHRPEDMYRSERRFLPWLASGASTVLDVGCAAGGFSEIWRHYRHDIDYTGVDVSSALIGAARKRYPEIEFLQGDCAAGLPLAEGYADVVSALGFLHWEVRAREAIRELWRLCGGRLFFDVRLVAESGEAVRGEQKVALGGPWDGETKTPYICEAWPGFAALLTGLGPGAILGYGYWGRPAETVVGVDREVCFTTFVLEKATQAAPPPASVCIDSPLGWPAALDRDVTVIDGSHLDSFVLQAQPG